MPRTAHAPLRLPEEFRKGRGKHAARAGVSTTLRAGRLVTVCEEARCPNLGECYASGTATFMILGDTCTRRCHFCAVKTGRPGAPSSDEPANLAAAAKAMDLSHVVITSVDRDDLGDCGAEHFASCITAVQNELANSTVEVLTPDFKGKPAFIDTVLAAQPDVFNHNIETVERLYRKVRPQSRFSTTTGVLRHVVDSGHAAVKSGLMVGLGESDDEVCQTLELLADVGVHIVTIGQYLRPTMKHWEVARYVDENSYERFRRVGEDLGFRHVFAGPFVRSSYRAEEAHILSGIKGRARAPRSLHVVGER